MIQKNKWKLLLTSAVILLPMLAGVILWNRLPDSIATHFGADGQADGWSSRPFAVFFLPLFLLAVHWLCTLVTAADPKHKNVDGKPLGLVLWICPVMSLLVGGVIYATALGVKLNINMVFGAVLGGMFVVIGNYLPKCHQNYTIGIKVPWTLSDEDNWNRTHRLGGKLWVAGGLLMIATAFFEQVFVYCILIVLLIMAVVPIVYSYILYKRK